MIDGFVWETHRHVVQSNHAKFSADAVDTAEEAVRRAVAERSDVRRVWVAERVYTVPSVLVDHCIEHCKQVVLGGKLMGAEMWCGRIGEKSQSLSDHIMMWMERNDCVPKLYTYVNYKLHIVHKINVGDAVTCEDSLGKGRIADVIGDHVWSSGLRVLQIRVRDNGFEFSEPESKLQLVDKG